jgi:N utilization substance protein B
MSRPRADAVTIPARITAQELANAIGRNVSEVTAILTARQEPDGTEDVLSADLAFETANELGASVVIEARDLTLECLYTYESVGELAEAPSGRAGHLFTGVTSQLDQLDARIEAASDHWSVVRMPVLDRNILRIGLYELENDRDTPTAVIVAEAVRMAQTYSTERSGSFVNGVLAALAQDVRG